MIKKINNQAAKLRTKLASKWKLAKQGKWLIFWTALFLLSQSWVADGLKGDRLFEKLALLGLHLDDHRIVLMIALAVLWCVSAFALYAVLPRNPPIRNLAPIGKPYAHKVLVMPLSAPSPKFIVESSSDGRKKHVVFGADKDGKQKPPVNLTGGIDELIEQFAGTNTQQVLRGLKPHLSEVERIYLIGSKDGSEPCLTEFEALIAACCANSKLKIIPHPEGLDFEDIDALYKAIHDAVLQFKDEQQYDDEHIMIDATGGQKTTSIAASLVTLHNHVKFQYVPTVKPFEAKSYELIFDAHSHFKG